MGSEIRIQGPAQVLETSRALQAANRRRLETRQADGWAERSAARTVAKALQFAENQVSRAAGRLDPWRGAVPEFEPAPLVRAQRLGKQFGVASAWWRWDVENRQVVISTADRSATATIQVPAQVFRSEFPLDDGVVWYQCLPAGGDRLVLLFYIQVPNATQQTVGSYVSTQTVGVAPQAIALAQQWINEYAAAFPNDPIIYRVRTSPGGIEGNNYVPITSLELDTLSTSFTDLQKNILTKAAVVTSSAINVVDWPAEYLEIATQKFYYLSDFQKGTQINNKPRSLQQVARVEYQILGGTSWTVDFQRFFKYVETSATNPPADFDGPTGKERYVYVPNLVASDTLVSSFANNNNYQNDDSIWLFLLRSYGYGKLINRISDPEGPEQDPAWGWTPAVFAFIAGYDGEFHDTNDPAAEDNALSYEYIRNTYFPLDGPAYMLDAGYVAGQHHYFRPPADGDVDYPAAFELPDSPNVSGAGVSPKPNRGPSKDVPVASNQLQDYEVDRLYPDFGSRLATYPWQQGQEVPIIAWDWGQPLACLLELQRLGFTATDLGLSPEEAAALAAADPAIDGFNFSQEVP